MCLAFSENTCEPPPITPCFCPLVRGTSKVACDTLTQNRQFSAMPRVQCKPCIAHAVRQVALSGPHQHIPQLNSDPSSVVRLSARRASITTGQPKPTRGVKNHIARNGTKLISCVPRGARYSSTIASPSVTQSRHVSCIVDIWIKHINTSWWHAANSTSYYSPSSRMDSRKFPSPSEVCRVSSE